MLFPTDVFPVHFFTTSPLKSPSFFCGIHSNNLSGRGNVLASLEAQIIAVFFKAQWLCAFNSLNLSMILMTYCSLFWGGQSKVRINQLLNTFQTCSLLSWIVSFHFFLFQSCILFFLPFVNRHFITVNLRMQFFCPITLNICLLSFIKWSERGLKSMLRWQKETQVRSC